MTDRNTEKGTGIWNWIDRIQGDKVIWMILILLILYSTVTIFSSTSQLASGDVSRLDIFLDQMFTIGGGMLIVFACYFIPKADWIRRLSQLGFAVSAVMLLMLVFEISTQEVNGAVRFIVVFGLQVHVYEFVKIFMIMYLAWAVDAYKTDSFWTVNFLAGRFSSLAFLSRSGWKRLIYIYVPILVVIGCILKGGFSSAMFIGGIMILTILIGGIPVKDIAKLLAVTVILIAGSYSIYAISGKKLFTRWGTVNERIANYFHPEDINELKPGTKEWREHLDEIRQPEGAKIAVKEGGIFGKGPGKSTQKYTVALIFSDYMFSFIIEEYGLVFGAIPLLILYISLLARGSIIVKYCDNDFARTAITGITLMISSQALLHMLINVGLWPLTGQTLPMISHGKSSFLAFSIGFGVLLCISKMAKKKLDQATESANSLIVDDSHPEEKE